MCEVEIPATCPTTHDLKTLPEFFQQVLDGTKTAEVRVNDRDYKVGDTLILIEYDNRGRDCTCRGVCRKKQGSQLGDGWTCALERYTGRSTRRVIGGITDLSSFSDRYVLLSFAPDTDTQLAAIRTALNAAPDADLVGLVEGLVRQREQLRGALMWCSGSADFAEGGQAHKGWNKVCAPLLADPAAEQATKEVR